MRTSMLGFLIIALGITGIGCGEPQEVKGIAPAMFTAQTNSAGFVEAQRAGHPNALISGGAGAVWTNTGSMNTGRSVHTATLLADGRVLVVGGFDGANSLASAEVYDPTTGMWSTVGGNPLIARYGHTATRVGPDGVFVVGGVDGSNVLTSVQPFSAASGVALDGISTLVQERTQHTATLLGNGKLLVIGGSDTGGAATATVESLDPINNTWSPMADMNVPRYGHTATLLGNGQVLVVGGIDGTAPTARVELYDPSMDSWSLAAPMMEHRADHSATLLSNGKVLVVGGYNDDSGYLATSELYDPMGDSWSGAGVTSNNAALHRATLLPNGKVLVTGGFNDVGYLDRTELYDPVTNTWATGTHMINQRERHQSTLLADGRVLLTGGSDGNFLASAEIYGSYALGAGCALSADCASGYCVSGICCNDPCPGACETCQTGICSPKANGSSCDDSNACTQTDACQNGVCLGTNPKSCPAAGSCQDPGTCDPATGTCTPVNKASGAICEDGNLCTQDDTCNNGVCSSGTSISCPAPDICHDAGTCNSMTGKCSYPAKANGTICNDGNACTQGDTCQFGLCTAGTTVICVSPPPCFDAGSCDPVSGCPTPVPVSGTPCDDGNACTVSDTCANGICVGGAQMVCPAMGICQGTGTCDAATGACTYTPAAQGTLCDDGDPCTNTDICDGAGLCLAGPLCAAPSACFEAGTCIPGVGCSAAMPKVCPADVCNDGTCDPVMGCQKTPKPAGTSCDDGDVCTIDVCNDQGSCTGLPKCVPYHKCDDVSCDSASGQCIHQEKPDCDPSASPSTAPPPKVPQNVVFCTKDGDCATGHCADGVCCNEACKGQCYSCVRPGAIGTCRPPEEGIDLRDECGLPGPDCSATCGADGQCVGADKKTHCAASECIDQVHLASEALCAGPGSSCPLDARVLQSCAPYRCIAAVRACGSRCNSIADCAPGFVCNPKNECVALPDVTNDVPSCAVRPGKTASNWPIVAVLATLGAALRRRRKQCATLGTTLMLAGCGAEGVDTNSNELTAQRGDAIVRSEPGHADWMATNSMANGRSLHTATLLSNGMVLIAGGGNPGPLAFAELYDPMFGTWSSTGMMNIGRYDHSATVLYNGNVLLAGGQSGGVEQSVEIYDPSNGQFLPQNPMSTPRRNHTATLVGYNRVLVVGGWNGTNPLQTAELYDPYQDMWSTAASMVDARYEHTATLLGNGKVLVVGGLGAGATILKSAEIYDPNMNTWLPATDAFFARRGHVATLLGNGKVLIAGGFGGGGGLVSAEIYDPSANQWSVVAPMNQPRLYFEAMLLGNGNVLVTGGQSNGNPISSTEMYNPSTNTWVSAGTMVQPRYDHTATLLPNGDVFIAGGWNGSSYTNSAERYAPFSLGIACTTASDCASGYCASNVCCDTPCTGACETCESGICSLRGGFCDDHNGCTMTDTCINGICIGTNPKTCSALDGCHDPGTCDPTTGNCSNPARPDGTTCSDGSLCTTSDTCQAGICQSGTSLACTSTNPCENATCNPSTGLCVFSAKPDGAVCDDGDACTENNVCMSGVCTGSPKTCPVFDSCSQPTGCNSINGLCTYVSKPNGTPCNDQNACTQMDVCMGELCVGTTAVQCAPPGPCQTAGVCNPSTGMCSYASAPTGSACEDGSACTEGDTCDTNGTCQSGMKKTCSGPEKCLDYGTCDNILGCPVPIPKTCPGNACTQGGCDSATGDCISAPKNEGTACDDGNVCTKNDACNATGTCVGLAVTCPAIDACHKSGMCEMSTGTCANESIVGCDLLEAAVSSTNESAPEVPKEAILCTVDSDCATGHCVDGVCCDNACTQACYTCVRPDSIGKCAPSKAGVDARHDCAPAYSCESTCDGMGECIKVSEIGQVAVTCALNECSEDRLFVLGQTECEGAGLECPTNERAVYRCAPFRCIPALGACGTTCASVADCSPPFVCDQNGSCVPPPPTSSSGAVASCSISRNGSTSTTVAWWLLAAGLAAMSRRKRAVGVFLGASILLISASASAQNPAPTDTNAPVAQPPAPEPPKPDTRAQAFEHYKRALAHYDRKAYALALPEFVIANRIHSTIGNSTALGDCLYQLQRYDESLDVFENVLREYRTDLPNNVKQAVQEKLEALRKLTGFVLITEAETDATIVIDGRMRGQYPTPSPINVIVGEHVVRVYKDGFVPFEGLVDVKKGQTETLEASLSPLVKSGRLHIVEGTKKSFDVVIDGIPVGATPWEGQLEVGEHRVLLRSEDHFGTLPQLVNIKLGQTEELILTAEDLGASIDVVPTPATASVFVDDFFMGSGSFAGRTRPGTHRIKVTAEGYFPETKTVNLALGNEERIALILKKDPKSPKWIKPGHFFVEVAGGVPLGPTLGGAIAEGCTGSCAASAVYGGKGVLSGGYEFPNGFSFGVMLGYAAMKQSTTGRSTSVIAQGLGENRGMANDDITARGFVAAVHAGLRIGERYPIRLRIAAGVANGSVVDTRTGSFRTTDPTVNFPYAIGPVSTLARTTWFFAEPEIRAGIRIREHWEFLAGLSALVLVTSQPPKWDKEQAIYASSDGYGHFEAEEITGSTLVGLTPGLSIRYEF